MFRRYSIDLYELATWVGDRIFLEKVFERVRMTDYRNFRITLVDQRLYSVVKGTYDMSIIIKVV